MPKTREQVPWLVMVFMATVNVNRWLDMMKMRNRIWQMPMNSRPNEPASTSPASAMFIIYGYLSFICPIMYPVHVARRPRTMMRMMDLVYELVRNTRQGKKYAFREGWERKFQGFTYGTRPNVATAAGRDRTPRETVSATMTGQLVSLFDNFHQSGDSFVVKTSHTQAALPKDGE